MTPKNTVLLKRNDTKAAATVIEKLIPDALTRKAVIEAFADDIHCAHNLSPGCWSITLDETYVRLNVGRIEAIALFSDSIHVVLHASHKPVGLEKCTDVSWDATAKSTYKSVPGSIVCDIPAVQFLAVWPLIAQSHKELIQRASVTLTSSIWANAHSPGVLHYFEEVLRDSLPAPFYSTISSEDDLEIDKLYSWNQVKLWGGEVTFLGKRDGRIVCATLDVKKNPDAPEVMVVGHKKKNVKRGKEFCEQKGSIPIFIKETTNHWRYKGQFEFVSSTTESDKLLRFENAETGPLSRIIFLRLAEAQEKLAVLRVDSKRHYLARLSYNSTDWQYPNKDAQDHEGEGTYNQENGFGHEDWLFRKDWLIDGWRYGFIQGVNRSHKKLTAINQPLDLTLFTIDDQKRRRYVARIHDVECLGNDEAGRALDEFKKRRWYQTMLEEIRETGADPDALGNAKWAKHVLNIRFKWENIRWFPPATYALEADPIFNLNRYTLIDLDQVERKGTCNGSQRHDDKTEPLIRPYMRKATQAVECDPEHARMQVQLMLELQAEYPGAIVVREQDFIDVTVRTLTEIILFEIKSDLDPRTVIRKALGQILEYAYHPCRKHSLPIKLVIVGRCGLSKKDIIYLDRLNGQFNLAIEYRALTRLSQLTGLNRKKSRKRGYFETRSPLQWEKRLTLE